MQCKKPLQMYKPLIGQSNKLVVNFPSGQSSNYLPLQIPCGQCTFCRLEQSRQWACRIMLEASMHEENCFITLTYDDDHLPPNRSLVKKDMQDFWKRLRKRLYPKKIRFYYVGEYGDQTHRPHYHAIIFGHNFSDDRKLYKHRSNPLYESDTLSLSWGKGFANFGEATFESAAYVARYCLKKVNRDLEQYAYACDIETGELLTRELEFGEPSRNPGIGSSWWHKYGEDVKRTDKVILRGMPMLPPRFFDKLCEQFDPHYFDQIKHKRTCNLQSGHATIEDVHEMRKAELARGLLQSAFKRRD